ncbi:hypothetical protein KY386_02990 [Candidatus Parcubacteria bacterium]|nr:hypothetical protein [Candidatus Parcubacteria bacterium]
MAPQNLDQYVSWVLDQNPEIKDLDPEIRQQLQADYVDSLENEVNAALLAAMPKDRLPDFERLAESGTTAQIEAFCEHHIPNIKEVVAAVLVRFKINYLGH